MPKFINPFTDWGFKRLFGREASKDLLVDFLNDLFEGELHVKDVTFKDKEQLADTKDLRGCIYDVYCETDDGKHFIVEMQNQWTANFVNRTLCYACKAITGQREKEKTKTRASLYELMPVYVISFMNFAPHEGDEVQQFKTDVMLRERNSERAFTDKLRFIYLNLTLFTKKAEDCETDFEKWIYVLKNMETLERIPFETQKKIFKRLAEVADSSHLSQADREKYEESQRMVDNYNLGMYSAWMQGNKEGELKKSLDIARKMLQSGITVAQIMQFTGLTQKQVCQLMN
jgi:predicted transposase/invertase (TIGR01784 family)